VTATRSRSTLSKSLLIAGLLAFPLIPGMPYDMVNTALYAVEYFVVALSLVLLIGMVGQISLCQAALVGMGAFLSAITTLRLGIDFPFVLIVGMATGALTAVMIGVVALRVRGLYLAVATLIFGYLCDQYLFNQTWLVQSQSGVSIPFQVIGKAGTIPSFDLADARTFYFFGLAVAALSLYAVANVRDSKIGRAFAAVRGSEIAAASLGIDVMRAKLLGFALAGCLAGLDGALILSAQRNVVPDQFNFVNSLYFLAIAVVGGLRSIGGALASAILFAVLVGEVFFRSPTLADYLDLISAGLLSAVLLFFRGGLGAVPTRVTALRPRVEDLLARLRARVMPQRQPAAAPAVVAAHVEAATAEASPRPGRIVALTAAVRRALENVQGRMALRQRRLQPAAAAPTESDSINEALVVQRDRLDITSLVRRARPVREPAAVMTLPTEREPEVGRLEMLEALARADTEAIAGHPAPGGRRLPVLLSAEGITVRFGGLTAVSDASLQVCAGEIVGLIGPNGAGKTTLFNSILGLNEPATGRVDLYGHDVSDWAVHRRAALGVGRTFQILQLFPDLTVFDNLLVATHLENHTGVMGSLLVTPGARGNEASARERVSSALELMGLEEFADRRVAGLPFGVLRLVEVARTLVTGARLVCFDEPASGLDSSETEQLIDWFLLLRRIGITLLVIEHDVSMVMRLCDYVYVLDQGRLIAHGSPAQVRNDPAVIASYLGGADDEEVA